MCIRDRFSLGSSLDGWLKDRGEAICVGRSWLPLLSPSLATASAFAIGESQAALSVALDLTDQGELEHYRFCLTQICPDATVDQDALEALAHRKPKARTTPAALKPLKAQITVLEQLVKVTTVLRERRLQAGSIDLNLPMPPLERLGDLLEPPPDGSRQGWLLEHDTSHPAALLREAILVAGRALGRHFTALELPALFAINPPAEAAEINEVAKTALALELPLELSADGNASAAELAAAFAGTDRSRALQQQLRDCLRPVQLSEEPDVHAMAGEPEALAPWCCPTLHYADIWNQQLLVTLLVHGKDRPTVRHKSGLDLASDSCHGAIEWALLTPTQLGAFQEARRQGLVQRLNGRSRLLGEFQADALAMAQARHAEPLVGRSLPGVISGVQSYGFFVEVPPSQVEGLVHVSSLRDDWYEYRSRQNRLVGRKSRRTYMVGDPVEVDIQKVDALRHQIDLAVLQPELSEADTPSQPGDDEADGESVDGTEA